VSVVKEPQWAKQAWEPVWTAQEFPYPQTVEAAGKIYRTHQQVVAHEKPSRVKHEQIERLVQPVYRTSDRQDPLVTPKQRLHRWFTDPDVGKDVRLLLRLVDQRDLGAETPCWTMRSCDRLFKYPTFILGTRRAVSAHRWMHELVIGPIPVGFMVDHECEQKRCVNPDHLEAVTNAENIRRSKARKAARLRATPSPRLQA